MTQQSFTNLLKSLDLRWHQVWHQFVSMSTVDISFKHCMLLFDFSNCQREHDEMVTFAGILETSSWLQNLPTLCKGSRVFDHEEPFWAHLDPFGPFQTRIDILLRSTSAKPYFVHFGQKNQIAWKSTKGTIAPLEWRLLVWHKRRASLTIDNLSNFRGVGSQPLDSPALLGFVLKSTNQPTTFYTHCSES